MATQLTGPTLIVCAVEREALGLGGLLECGEHRRFGTLVFGGSRPSQKPGCQSGDARRTPEAGRPARLLVTGVGTAAATAALDALAWRPSLVISVGFAGALDSSLQVGDLVLADAVLTLDGRSWPVVPPPNGLPGVRHGAVLTSPGLVGDPAAKRQLAHTGALVVEMEAAAVAEWCRRRDVPFACLKAVSDAAETPLSPQLVGLLAGGAVGPVRLLAALARRPRLLGELWRLAGATRLAARRLGAGLRQLHAAAGGVSPPRPIP